VSRRGEGDLRVADSLCCFVLAELLSDATEMSMVAQQVTYGGPLVGELTEAGEGPVLDRRLASQIADCVGSDGAFQMGMQVSLGQQAKIPHLTRPYAARTLSGMAAQVIRASLAMDDCPWVVRGAQ
jgi:hypothetical protein